MLRSLKTTSWGLVAVGAISALCEADWRISFVLVAAGFGGLIIYGLSQGGLDNDRYRAAVLAHRPAGSDAQVPTMSPIVGLIVLVCFLSVAGLSVHLDSPWPCGIAFVSVVAIGLPWMLRRTTQRNSIWRQFALDHELTFDKGCTLDYLENARITGKHDGRDLRLEIVWQEKPSSDRGRRRSEILIAEVSTRIADQSFCVDDLKIPDSAPDLARHLFESQELKERIEATTPGRISLFEESLTFHFPRVPGTEIELTFYTCLLIDTVSNLERFWVTSGHLGTN